MSAAFSDSAMGGLDREEGENGSDLPVVEPLSALAGRVLGALMEKAFATPDLYPLTLNALTNACNQRSNRDPVIAADSREVELALEELRRRRLAILVVGSEARVPKYKHKFSLQYPVDEVDEALVCELLLRGPQTTASLRSNAERLGRVPELGEVEDRLQRLAERAEGALVVRLPRLVGQKEPRWAQLLTGQPDVESMGKEPESLSVSVVIPPEIERRLQGLEAEVSALRAQLDRIRTELGIA